MLVLSTTMLAQHPDSHTLKYVGELSTVCPSVYLAPQEITFFPLRFNILAVAPRLSVQRKIRRGEARRYYCKGHPLSHACYYQTLLSKTKGACCVLESSTTLLYPLHPRILNHQTPI